MNGLAMGLLPRKDDKPYSDEENLIIKEFSAEVSIEELVDKINSVSSYTRTISGVETRARKLGWPLFQPKGKSEYKCSDSNTTKQRPPEQKAEALRLIEKGASIIWVAKKLNLPKSTVSGWKRAAKPKRSWE